MNKAILIPLPHLSSVNCNAIEPIGNEKWKYKCRYLFDLKIDTYSCNIYVDTDKDVADRELSNNFLHDTIKYISDNMNNGKALEVFNSNTVYTHDLKEVFVSNHSYPEIVLNPEDETCQKLIAEIKRRNKIDTIFR